MGSKMVARIPKVVPLSKVNNRGNIISTALFISSSMKLLPILTAIWEYDVPASARAVGWAVVVNNIEALTSMPFHLEINLCSLVGNDVFEYFNVILIGSFCACVDRLDDPRLDNVGRGIGETCSDCSGKVG
jgi:hypothetical protein